jgi:hypothetical protein
MRSESKKAMAPALGQQGTALARALDKSEQVQSKVIISGNLSNRGQ